MTPRPALPAGTELREWDGWCLELVDSLLHKHPDGRILYVDLEHGPGPWKYHTAMVLDGLVYDAWFPTVRLPPGDYVERVFGPGVEWEVMPLEEEDAETAAEVRHG